VDVRAGKLQKEYQDKARAADRRQGVPEGTVGRVEDKLLSLGEVRGLVAGQFGEVSEATHDLVAVLATCRVRVAGPTRGKQGRMRSEDAERAMAVSSLRRRLGVMAVRCQASSLLGRLETLGPGGTAAMGRRTQAADLEWRWRRERTANELAARQGRRILRGGFAKTD
jgi:hypothetical protein